MTYLLSFKSNKSKAEEEGIRDYNKYECITHRFFCNTIFMKIYDNID